MVIEQPSRSTDEGKVKLDLGGEGGMGGGKLIRMIFQSDIFVEF